MKKIKILEKEIYVFDSIKEISAERYHLFNLFYLQSCDIGNGIEFLKNKITESYRYVFYDREKNEILESLNHLYYCIVSNENQISLLCKAFACLVKSENQIDEIVEEIKALPIGEMKEHIDFFQNTVKSELRVYFPKMLDSLTENTLKSLQYQIALLRLDSIIENIDLEDKIFELEKKKTKLYSVRNWQSNNENSTEVSMIKTFEMNCVFLQQKGFSNPKQQSFFSFLTSLEYLQKYENK